MVFTKQDNEEKVIAWAELRLVDETGREDAKGVYIWINEVWVHELHRTRNRFNEVMQEFIKEGRDRFPQAKYIYWQRDKYGERMSLYSRGNILRRSYGRQEKGRLHRTATAVASANTITV